jgi:transcriptional regulator of acetoin/glycerol metabolism
MADAGGYPMPHAPGAAAGGGPALYAPQAVADSWRRCVDRYRLDASAKQRVASLSSFELRGRREPLEEVLAAVEDEIHHVAEPLSAAGFSVSFGDMAGVVLYYRSDRAAGHYVDVEREGTLWPEGVTGTNGVGTCLVERKPVHVFKNQHFFRDFAHLSCCAAPVMSPDGEMLGVLNFTTGDPNVSEGAFRLACGLVAKGAERVGDQLFRRRHRASALLSARSAAGSLLLAVDDDHTIVGANPSARRWLRVGDGSFGPRSLWDVFEMRDSMDLGADARRVRLRRDGEETEFSIQARPEAGGPRPARTPVASASTAVKAGRKIAPAASEGPDVESCLGADPRMRASLRLLRRVSGSRMPILLLGETGVGKDTLARALHREGDRGDKIFSAFNCAAVPESLIDSELFGYGAGAFTGARREGNPGRLAEADGGTLFLDEIGDMPLSLQTRLLRVLETGEVTPLGSGKARRIDVQVIAATNHDVKQRVADGLFRADLYHRLAAVVVALPPLRERADLAELIGGLFACARGHGELALSTEAFAALMAYPWPGNVRELKYVLQRAALVCEGRLVGVDDLMLDHGAPVPAMASTATAPPAPAVLEPSGTARGAVAAAEKLAIERALAAHDGDVTRSARALKLSRATLYRKLRQHQLGGARP